MAKRFSLVRIENHDGLCLPGWVAPQDLADCDDFAETMMSISCFDTVEIEIEHCLFLDFPDNDTDMSEDEIEDMLEIFDDLVENDNIYSEEVISFQLDGLNQGGLIE